MSQGRGERLARWWCGAAERGGVGLARSPASPVILALLADARRSRRIERGLEDATEKLTAEEAGLRRAGDAARPTQGARISRLLVVSADGSARFYRQVARLVEEHAGRLIALMLECDERELGEAVFGRDRRARAVLVTHKEAVVRLLGALEDHVG